VRCGRRGVSNHSLPITRRQHHSKVWSHKGMSIARCLSPQNIDTMHRFSDVQCVCVRVYACIFAHRLVSATTTTQWCFVVMAKKDTRVSETTVRLGSSAVGGAGVRGGVLGALQEILLVGIFVVSVLGRPRYCPS
jgi:hypothetical protein